MHLTHLRDHRAAQWFRRFRRTRPFWGGLLVLVAGVEIGLLPLGPTDDLIKAGHNTAIGLACAAALLLMGALILALPSQRILAGLVAVGVSLASFVLSNLGGFAVGMVLGVIGGSMAVGWVPDLSVFQRSERRWARG